MQRYTVFVCVLCTLLLAVGSYGSNVRDGGKVSAWAGALAAQAAPLQQEGQGASGSSAAASAAADPTSGGDNATSTAAQAAKEDEDRRESQEAEGEERAKTKRKRSEELEKASFKTEFSTALEKAQQKEEAMKAGVREKAERVAEEKAKNATRLRAQAEKKEKRHEENMKADEKKRREEDAKATVKKEQQGKAERQAHAANTRAQEDKAKRTTLKKKWAVDKFNVLSDIRRNMLVDPATGGKTCSQNGRWNNRTRKCDCNAGHFGPICSYRGLAKHHGHGRFVGLSNCEHGEPLDGGGCNCTEGWYGYHCHFKKCVHGARRCPVGRKFCLRQRCVCEKPWFGMFCDQAPVVRPPPPPPCGGKSWSCAHDGYFNNKTCTCECPAPWTGRTCDQCVEAKVFVKRGMVLDKQNCQAACPANRTCGKHGVLDRETCECKCPPNFSGPECGECPERSCNGHGIFDKRMCGCLCDVPFLPKSDCQKCRPMDCGAHGTFDPFKCKCRCKGGWKGLVCDKCGREDGDSCPDGHIFDESECKCTAQCKPVECQNGGVQDPKTCKCKCNVGAIDLDERQKSAAIQELLHLVRAKFGAKSPVLKAVKQSLEGFVAGQTPKGSMVQEVLSFIGTTKFADVQKAMKKLKHAVHFDEGEEEAGRKNETLAAMKNLGATNGTRKAMSFKSSLVSLLPSLAQNPGSSFLEIAEVSDVDNTTYWAGETCGRCNMPSPPPCRKDEIFDMEKCACAVECPKPVLQCANGGKLNDKTCHCACPPGWSGKTCETEANGLTKNNAVHSCKELLQLKPDTPSGGYWLKPKDHSGEPFLTRCDMTLDGGGWTQVARVQENVGLNYDAASYLEGVSPKNSETLHSDFIIPCGQFDGLDGKPHDSLKDFMIRVTVGFVRDFYRASDMTKTDLCELLSSNDKHVWSANGGGLASRIQEDAQLKMQANTGWLKPVYSELQTVKVLGGSNESWPMAIDGRKYLSMWGGYKGGCCHERSNLYHDGQGHGVDSGGWSQKFEVHVLEVPPKAGIAVPKSDGIDLREGSGAAAATSGNDASGEDAGSGSGSKEDGEIPIPNMLTKAKKGDIMK